MEGLFKRFLRDLTIHYSVEGESGRCKQPNFNPRGCRNCGSTNSPTFFSKPVRSHINFRHVPVFQRNVVKFVRNETKARSGCVQDTGEVCYVVSSSPKRVADGSVHNPEKTMALYSNEEMIS
ncbi:hypothetical protein CDAR_75761 [Caerostris darwini]|uniref:Uncharacterized protein n=1 Tax=Caerostris darwini TaxID=1538125 RepID=A0AAV4W1W8_9ARAC|nr:hypothetical protein CDAR_75761 [Caerostris darwini]